MKPTIVLIILINLFSYTISAQQEQLSMNKGWSFKYLAPDSK